MSNLRRGRRPLSSKKPQFKHFGLEASTVPEGVLKYAKENDLAIRWLNPKRKSYTGGVGGNYWRPLKVAKKDFSTMGLDNSFAVDTEGYIRKGDLVLGCRSMEIHKEHRQYLDYNNALQRQAVDRYGVDELKSQASQHGINVVGGYDE